MPKPLNPAPAILAFAGSTRTDSLNKLLVQNAARFVTEAGGKVTLIDLRDYPMPLYDGDLESDLGIPDNAVKLRELMMSHHGLLLSCPEYNSSISAVLKNTIDWVSRPVPEQPPLVAFKNKTAGLLAASPGSIGGLRVLASVRSILGNLGMMVIPRQYGIANATSAFDESGTLTDSTALRNVTSVATQLVDVTAKLISNNHE